MSTYKYTALSLVSLFTVGLIALPAMAQGGGDAGEGSTSGDQVRWGTAGAVELLVPLTARYSSLASSTTSSLPDMNGLEALYSNPAGLSNNTGTTALFSRMNYVAAIGVNFFGVGHSTGDNHLAFTISSWDFGDIPRQTEVTPEITDVTFGVTYITAGVTYARVLTDRIAAGTTAKIVNEAIDDMSATTVVFDAGMTYVVGETGLRLGVSLKNIGLDIQFDGTGLTRRAQIPNQLDHAAVNALAIETEANQLATLLNFGAAYSMTVGAGSVLTVLGNFRSNSFDQDQFSGGVELGIRDLVYLRGGFELTENSDVTFWKGYSYGAGLNLELSGTRLTLDYAMLPTDFFEDVQFITVAVEL